MNFFENRNGLFYFEILRFEEMWNFNDKERRDSRFLCFLKI